MTNCEKCHGEKFKRRRINVRGVGRWQDLMGGRTLELSAGRDLDVWGRDLRAVGSTKGKGLREEGPRPEPSV